MKVILAWRLIPTLAVKVHRERGSEIKAAYESGDLSKLGGLSAALQLTPGKFLGIPNHPSPLFSQLVGGLGGAALGYGLGWAGEHYLPRSWRRGNLRMTGALLGGALGAAPGTLWGVLNRAGGRPFYSSKYDPTPMTDADIPQFPYNKGYHAEEHQADIKRAALAPLLQGSGLSGLTVEGVPGVPVEEFNQMIWRDPRVAGPLAPNQQAAASGLITAAANLPGKQNTRLVTPLDVGRMAAGMGSGFLSGALVGRALGVLMGMPEEQQDRLKETGMMAGMIANIVPLAFGGSGW